MADIENITLAQAVETIKTAILQSQARAARNISANQLALYFSVGGYISLNTRQQQWGSGAVKNISERLQKELPGLQGFSPEKVSIRCVAFTKNGLLSYFSRHWRLIYRERNSTANGWRNSVAGGDTIATCSFSSWFFSRCVRYWIGARFPFHQFHTPHGDSI